MTVPRGWVLPEADATRSARPSAGDSAEGRGVERQWGDGFHITFCPMLGNRMLTLCGRLRRPFVAIDLRLQSHQWLRTLEARGGHDLTVVAAGRAELCRLFERDAERSPYDKPQRHLAMVCVKGPQMGFDGIPMLPAKLNLLAPDAEWMTETFERFYQLHGHATHTFNNLLLEPMTAAGRDLLIAQYGSDGRFDNQEGRQLLANAFAENFNDPNVLTPMLLDQRKMRQFIERTTGQSWMPAMAGGAWASPGRSCGS